MAKIAMKLWETTPGVGDSGTPIYYYPPHGEAVSDCAIIAIPGGAYRGLSQHEGYGYGEYFSYKGFHTFSIDYHTIPHKFPTQLLEARRAVRWVRAHAAEYGIDPNKIAVIGSSAGGHLTALLSTYTSSVEGEGLDEIDNEDYMPNAQILCYPVICNPENEELCHAESYRNLVGGRDEALERALDPSLHVVETTPPAFLFSTSEDASVSVINSFTYAAELRRHRVPFEMHVLPHGQHGMGVWLEDPHNSIWSHLMIRWLRQLGWLKEENNGEN
ncbi:MAG: alpha/beta hydrolase [Clostridia bacterium]|nr:alpha/beta hydrolase [Clostridia bacterium]